MKTSLKTDYVEQNKMLNRNERVRERERERER